MILFLIIFLFMGIPALMSERFRKAFGDYWVNVFEKKKEREDFWHSELKARNKTGQL